MVGAVTAGSRGGGGSLAAGNSCGGRRTRARAAADDDVAVEVNTGQPSEEGQADVGVNVDTSSTTENGSKLSTCLKREREQAVTTCKDGEDTTQDGRQELVDGLKNERQEVANQATTANVDAHINVNTDGEPEENNRLKLDTKRAVRAGDPLNKTVTGLGAESAGRLAIGDSLESSLDVRVELGAEVTLEEGSERRLSAGRKDTLLVDAGTNVSTNGDGGQATSGHLAQRDEAVARLALNPREESGHQVTGERDVRAVEESLQSAHDVGLKTADETTTSGEVQGRLDLLGETGATVALQELLEGVLQRGAENKLTPNVGGAQDTVEGDDETTLGGDVSGRRAQDRETSGDIDFEKTVITASGPAKQGLAERLLEVRAVVTAQPRSQLLASVGLAGTSLETHRSSLKSRGRIGLHAVEQFRGALAAGATTKEAGDETTEVEVNVDVNADVEATAVHGHIGRVGEGCARQPGEHKKVVRTHYARSKTKVSPESSQSMRRASERASIPKIGKRYSSKRKERS